jgi:hypothetical protein
MRWNQFRLSRILPGAAQNECRAGQPPAGISRDLRPLGSNQPATQKSLCRLKNFQRFPAVSASHKVETVLFGVEFVSIR